eukprot:1643309-Prymnesium_polylepis.1
MPVLPLSGEPQGASTEAITVCVPRSGGHAVAALAEAGMPSYAEPAEDELESSSDTSAGSASPSTATGAPRGAR